MGIVGKAIKLARKLWNIVYFRLDPVGCSRSMGVVIGSGCRIYGGSPSMWGSEPYLVTLGDRVFIAPNCQFVCHDGGTLILRTKYPSLEITAPIAIESNVYIGMNSIVLFGVVIGSNCIVGAGSVVSRSLEPGGVYAGVPARRIKSIDEYESSVLARSLEVGHLGAADKEQALRKMFLKSDPARTAGADKSRGSAG